jgi:hypothetical protein
MKRVIAGLIGVMGLLPVLAAAPPAAAPPVAILLKGRHGHATPVRTGFTHTGGGYIDIAQPTPDVVIVTMTGVAVAGAHPCRNSEATLNFDLTQEFEIGFDSPKRKKAKLFLEGRVIGLLRSDCKSSGFAAEGPGCATIVGEDGQAVVTLCVAEHSVTGGENLSVNDHDGPVEVPILGGKYTLHQTFTITAAYRHGFFPNKVTSAEFAPEPALDPLWLSYWEPFHGLGKRDFGFLLSLKVAEENGEAAPAK